MTIFQLLKADHRKVKALFKKLDKTEETDAEVRGKLFSELKRNLEIHSKAEDMTVYKRCETKDKLHDLTLEAREEHHLVDHLLAQLDSLDKSDETWGAKCTVLSEMIDHHVEEEEQEMFKKIRAAFEPDEIRQMAVDFTTFKKTLSFRLIRGGLRAISRAAA